MKKLFFIVLLSIFAVTPSVSFAYSHVIDGKIASDWGVNPTTYVGYNGNASWIPYSGINYTIEDQTGDKDTYLTPGYGGQLFDAEAMYIDYDNNNLYYAIVTGFPPEGADGIIPGDIGINFGNGYEFGVAVSNAYPWLNDPNKPLTGGLYQVAAGNWDHNQWPGFEDNVNKINWVDGTDTKLLAMGEQKYEKLDDLHWIIEGSISTSFFESDWYKYYTISWTETCGNDVIKVAAVPEPATMSLLGLGLLGILGFKRKK